MKHVMEHPDVDEIPCNIIGLVPLHQVFHKHLASRQQSYSTIRLFLPTGY
jgi:hypothetical protein